MTDLSHKILSAKEEGKELFYNSSGSKLAYQLGIKHIGSAEFLGFVDTLPNGKMRVKKDFLLVDFENNKIVPITKGTVITPIKLDSY